MNSLITSILLLICPLVSCGQQNRNVEFFKGTKAYNLAKAVAQEDLNKIEDLVKRDRSLLDVTSKTGSNVLVLCLYVEAFNSFEKLLELGANPNFTNPYTKYSVLISACKPFGSELEWRDEIKYAKLLLEYGADPNYVVKQTFTNSKGNRVLATSPLIRASALDLELVQLLIKNGASIELSIDRGRTPFSKAVAANRFDIIYYFIDSLNVNIHQPFRYRNTDTLYVQDYIKAYMSYKPGTKGEQKKDNLVRYLENKGVDFANYKYKL